MSQFVCACACDKQKKDHFAQFQNVSSYQREKLALARLFLSSPSWSSGRRQSVGLETLLFCDHDCKDKPRNTCCF